MKLYFSIVSCDPRTASNVLIPTISNEFHHTFDIAKELPIDQRHKYIAMLLP